MRACGGDGGTPGCIPQLLQSRTVQVPAYVPDSEYVRTSYDDPPVSTRRRLGITFADSVV